MRGAVQGGAHDRHRTGVTQQGSPTPDVDERDDDESPTTPLDEPPPEPIQDPPAEPGPQGPLVVRPCSGETGPRGQTIRL